MTTTVFCQICKKDMGSKGFPSHLKSHKILFKEYLEKHLEDFSHLGWQRCDNCNEKITKKQGEKWVTCSTKCSAEMKSKLYKGQTTWNKGIPCSEETKKKISDTEKGRPGKPHSKETKEKLSQIAKARVLQPDYKNPMLGRTHTPESIAKICKDRVGSSLELKVIEILKEMELPFIHQFFVTKDGRSYSYDFKLKGLPILIEADGDYWHGGPGVNKHFVHVESVKKNDLEKERIAMGRGYDLIRVWESEINTTPYLLKERILQLL